jgi:hypothetical protein
MILVALALVLIALELGLILTVRVLRREFQWLITEADELPVLDSQALRKFIDSSFDARLGWVRRPNTTGVEKGKKGDITFHIDSSGARVGVGQAEVQSVAAFGDSYVFCRQVEDGETWESELSRRLGIGVMNFGVGNYGVDQALLRYQGTALPDSIRVVVLGFVPETICRIQSCWKHYLEFGNTFAFKPRFSLSAEGVLVAHENPMQSAVDFAELRRKLPQIQEADGFYRRKFRSPYLLSFLRHPVRHAQLIGALVLRRLARLAGVKSHKLEALPFALIMAHNIRDAHRMYRDSEACQLLRAILLHFKQEAIQRGHVPLILVIPQLLDLRIGEGNTTPYQVFFRELDGHMPVIDMTAVLKAHSLIELYIDDRYGGHLSARGNGVVAEQLEIWLQQRMGRAQSKGA